MMKHGSPAAWLLAFMGVCWFASYMEAQTPAKPKALEVRELVIRDDMGRERIEIAVRSRTAAIVFYDAKHVETLRLVSMEKGGAAINFPDRKGVVLANIGMTPDGNAAVSVGQRGKNYAGLVGGGDGSVAIIMTSKDGLAEFGAALDAAGNMERR